MIFSRERGLSPLGRSASPNSPLNPRSRAPRPRALWLGGAASALLLLAGLGACYPIWASNWAKNKAISRLENRLKVNVSIDEFELGYHGVTLKGFRLARENLQLKCDNVEVGWSGLGWNNGFPIVALKVHHATLDTTLDAIRAWRDDLRTTGNSGQETGSPAKRRPLPASFEVDDFAVVVRSQQESSLWKEARVHVSAQRVAPLMEHEPPKIAIAGSDVDIELHDGRHAGAGHFSSTLEFATSQTYDLKFPLTIAAQEGFAEITKRLNLAGVHGKMTLQDANASSIAIDLGGGFSDARQGDGTDLWTLRGEGKRDLSEGAVTLAMEDFELRRVPRALAALPLVDSEQATIGGKVHATFKAGKLDTQGNLAVNGLNIEHPLLAREPVLDVGFLAKIDATFDPEARAIELRNLELSRGALKVEIEGSVRHPAQVSERRYEIAVRVPEIPCQSVLDEIPRELIPALRGMTLAGTYSLETKLHIDFSDLESLSLVGLKESFGLRQCRPLRVPVRLSPTRLMGDLVHTVTLRDGTQHTSYLSPLNPEFAPLEEISPTVAAAVLTTEDGSFWRHDGFLTSQIAAALRSNLEAGKVRLGASTITMQMVKNIFLSHERTLSRKFQEVLLTWYVERSLPKERIMELYLNVIEFGPGIYGITAAADHYFGKTPFALNSLESAYLALMLPSPVRRHEHFCNGELSRAFEVKLRRIHGLMAQRGHIGEQDYLVWKDAPLIFDPRDRQDPKACLREIKTMLEASAGQKALSGLLGGAVSEAELRSVPWATARTKREGAVLRATSAAVPAVGEGDGHENGQAGR